MVADSIAVTDGGTLRGEITSRGQLLDAQGYRLAGFVQRLQLTLGGRVATVEIYVDPVAMPAADPWKSDFAVRHAWADKTAELRRSVHLGSFVTQAKRFEAPEFVEVVANEERTAASARRTAVPLPRRLAHARHVVDHRRRDVSHISARHWRRCTTCVDGGAWRWPRPRAGAALEVAAPPLPVQLWLAVPP